jgi:Tfp pilus assembly protein PilF
MPLNVLALALVTSLTSVGPSSAAPAADMRSQLADAPMLAAQPLAAGRSDEALVVLERASLADPHDPAVLINLGIAYARAGDEAKARVAFAKALACREVVELDTAGGATLDSRKLALKALRMLERGEFRADSATAGKLTYRQ